MHKTVRLILSVLLLSMTICGVFVYAQQATVKLHLREKGSLAPISSRITFESITDPNFITEVSGFTGWSAQRHDWNNELRSQAYWYVTSDCEFTIPSGQHRLIVNKGLDYIPGIQDLNLSSGQVQEITMELEKLIDMGGLGWYSGDAHLHMARFDPSQDQGFLDLFEAENLNIAPLVDWAGRASASNPQVPAWGGWVWNTEQLGYEARNGNFIICSAQDWSPPGVTCCLKFFGNVTPVTEQISVYGQAFISKAVIDEGGIAVGSLNNIFAEGAILNAFTGVEEFWGGESWISDDELNLWYDFLNVGCKIAILAGTDVQSGGDPELLTGYQVPPATNKYYVNVDGAFDKNSWIRGMGLGKTFVTSGPALFLTVNGKKPGEEIDLTQPGNVTVSIEIVSPNSPEGQVILLRNGASVWNAALGPADAHYQNSFQVNIPESSWLAVRLNGNASIPGNIRSFALTSPVYITVDNKPVFVTSSYDNVLLEIPSEAAIMGSSLTSEQKTIAVDWVNMAKNVLSLRQNQVSGGVPNYQPDVIARSNQSISLAQQAILSGIATDDGKPSNTLTSTWSLVSGPTGGQVFFADENAKNTTATFDRLGRYVLRMTASDGDLSGSGDIVVNVIDTGSTGIPTKLSVSSDPSIIEADGTSSSMITVRVLDVNNSPVATSTATITFSLSGSAEGNLSATQVQAQNGTAIITYTAGTQVGTATITATSTGLTSDSTDITLILNNPPSTPTGLLCNGQSNPLDLTDFSPDLSWTFNDPDVTSGDKQGAYRILVADSQSALDTNNGSIWDTNKVTSSNNAITYAGLTLQANTQYFWKVMTWDSFDTQGPYSQSAVFTMSDIDPRCYNGIPFAVPGKIETEDFDNGGEGVAYHDTDAGNNGNQYRTSEGVDIENCSDIGSGYNVGWTSAGEWLEYTVNVGAAGTYTIEARTAQTEAGGIFHIEFGGVDKTGALSVSNTGAWQSYATVTKTGVSLSAGKQIMRISMDTTAGNGNVGNFNYIDIKPESVTPTITVTSPNGGQTWIVNSQQTVTWTSVGTVGNTVGIDLSTDGGSNWTSLISDTSNDGTQDITVPDSQSTACRIRVADISGPPGPGDTSDNDFTISLPPQSQITVASPNGQETWQVGSQQAVTWTSQGSVGNVNIELSTDGGSNWTTLASATVNDGLQNITVPNSPSATCKIRVQDVSGSPSDVSNMNFTIEESPDPSYISVSKTTLDFGDVEIGNTGTLDLVITNTGGGTLSGSISTSKKWIEVSPTSFSGNNVTVNVTVDNSVLNQPEGEYTGTISITSNGGNINVEVTLVATCVLPKPNPYNPAKGNLTFFGDGIVPGNTTIRIYTLNGEIVKTLEENKGKKKIRWDGKSEQGEEIASGIYIYVFESPNEKGVGKLTVIKQ